jgi:SAM-dependent methyltransferase
MAPPGPKRPPGAFDLNRFPNVYDAAFSWDRSREARTYLEVASSLRGNRPASAVELGCGSGPLARIWAKIGLDVFGVDRSPAAIARARELSARTVPSDHWLVSDLRSFRLKRRVDLAVVPLDTLGYLVEAEELTSFFRAAHRSLRTGGVLAADLTLHPGTGPPLAIRSAWRVSLRPKGDLWVRWESYGRARGTPARRWEWGRVTVRAPDGTPKVYWEAALHAALSARDISDLAEDAGGFSAMLVYSDAAHRARSRRLRSVKDGSRAIGSRLVAWVRT